MDVEKFMEIIGHDHFFTGVPDSYLSMICKYLMDNYGISNKHIIGVDEGSCTAIAAGNYLSTGEIPVIYMQNSGIGNTINTIVSLISPEVYGIPCIYIVGWRGEPGIHDEPQHVLQGKITPDLLKCVGVNTIFINSNTVPDDFKKKFDSTSQCLKNGESIAIIVSKDALTYNSSYKQINKNIISREDAIKTIVEYSNRDVIVSTTGKTSRELYEIREKRNESHETDFLTVGSMGYSSSIALGISLKSKKNVWCIDGDGSILMHMGVISTIGSMKPEKFIHIIINNESHESVGGYPTTISSTDICSVAKACGYFTVASVDNINDLNIALANIRNVCGPHLIEIRTTIGSRSDLGRPTTTPVENKKNLMSYLKM